MALPSPSDRSTTATRQSGTLLRAEADFQRFFCVTPPSVHQMILQLERLGFIRRTPRQARSIELLVPAEQLPALQPIKTSVERY